MKLSIDRADWGFFVWCDTANEHGWSRTYHLHVQLFPPHVCAGVQRQEATQTHYYVGGHDESDITYYTK